MGAQLACLLAGSGSRVTLLDVDAATAKTGLDRAAKLRPSPLYVSAHLDRIRVGGLDQLEAAIADADWVLEAIVERLEPKKELFARVETALSVGGGWIVTTNTSGLSIAALAEGRGEAFRRRFFGTHFFNPPRYARPARAGPARGHGSAAMAGSDEFASRLLGKGTVRAKDTPAFIANRLGVHGLLTALRLAAELGLGIDEVDDLTGPLIGRPKSATFRTLDLVGIDVAVAVADHCYAALADDPDREAFAVPPVLRQLIERGATGREDRRRLLPQDRRRDPRARSRDARLPAATPAHLEADRGCEVRDRTYGAVWWPSPRPLFGRPRIGPPASSGA